MFCNRLFIYRVTKRRVN